MKWLVAAEQKLAPFLSEQFGGKYSGKQMRRALEANLCRVNGSIERFGSKALKRGDFVELSPTWKSILSPNLSGMAVIFEDEYFKIVDKATGWICDDRQTLRTFGPKHFLVHRLDKDTTGLLILAKSHAARQKMIDLFEKRQIEKSYLAIVDGIPKKQQGDIESLLAKKGAFEGQTLWGSSSKGLTAQTAWEKVGEGKQCSLLLCKPFTGRTHQIRVHLSEMGHPILIDRQYAKSFRCKLFIQRPLLHAYRLQWVHPFTGKELDLKAPLPVDIRDVLLDMSFQMAPFGQLFDKEKEQDSGDEGCDDKDAEEIVEGSQLVH